MIKKNFSLNIIVCFIKHRSLKTKKIVKGHIVYKGWEGRVLS